MLDLFLLNAWFEMFWRRNKKKQIDCGSPQKAKVNLAKQRERDLRRFSITAVRSPVSSALELATARTIRSRETMTLSVGGLRTITTLLEQIDNSSNIAGLSCLISGLKCLNSGLEADSSLTVLVTGDVDLKSSLQMKNLSVLTESGQPRFAIYSLGESVQIDGSSQAMAIIYAPFAAVDIGGSGGLRGAVWGERIDVSGAGRIIGEGSFVDGANNGSTRAGNGSWAPFN